MGMVGENDGGKGQTWPNNSQVLFNMGSNVDLILASKSYSELRLGK
jgi:hypothetical protein